MANARSSPVSSAVPWVRGGLSRPRGSAMHGGALYHLVSRTLPWREIKSTKWICARTRARLSRPCVPRPGGGWGEPGVAASREPARCSPCSEVSPACGPRQVCSWSAACARRWEMASLPAHTLRIQRLYRGGLKTLMNWTVHRDLWIEEGFKLRAEFDANKHETNAQAHATV